MDLGSESVQPTDCKREMKESKEARDAGCWWHCKDGLCELSAAGEIGGDRERDQQSEREEAGRER